MKKEIIIILALMALGSMVAARPLAVFDSSTRANATWINGTVGQSQVLINATLNETIHLNASSFVEWYNATNASTNVTVITVQTANYSAPGSVNYTYWRFNLSNDGVHRFVVRLDSTNSSDASPAIERYIYYDNSTPQFSVSRPSNGENFLDTAIQANITLNFVANDTATPGILNACFFSVNNGSLTRLSNCVSNITFLADYGERPFNFTINDSAGNMNSTYFTFRANSTGSSGGGGGGASSPLGLPAVPEVPAIVTQQPVGIHSIAGTGPLGDVGNAVTNFINSIINVIRGFLGLTAVQQPQQPASIIQPNDKPSGLFGIWKNY